MSLIRSGLVLGAVVYMMPTDVEKQKQLIHTASDTLEWGVTGDLRAGQGHLAASDAESQVRHGSGQRSRRQMVGTAGCGRA